MEYSSRSWSSWSLSRRRLLAAALPLGAAVLAACSGGVADAELVARPKVDQWPDLVLRAGPELQEAYRDALANPDVLQYMPCYCGCVTAGHTSNKDCYIREQRADGSVLLEPMSFT